MRPGVFVLGDAEEEHPRYPQLGHLGDLGQEMVQGELITAWHGLNWDLDIPAVGDEHGINKIAGGKAGLLGKDPQGSKLP
jgi:hypothetical protein